MIFEKFKNGDSWKMSFQQLTMLVHREETDVVEEILTLTGAVSISYLDAKDNPIYEPPLGTTPLWDDVILQALFEKNINFVELNHLLEETFAHPFGFQIETVSAEDWQKRWQQEFSAKQFGRLWICPSHETVTDPNAIIVKLDPGMAFGTGSHPTTALCLQWLADNLQSDSIVVDFGCGSGILAIAAAKLGAKKVYAIDNDPQAILATQSNANDNDLSDTQIICLAPENIPASLKADVIVANILANPLIELAPMLTGLLKPNGQLVLSGILAEQGDSVIHAYQSFFAHFTVVQQQDWLCIAFE